jgi:protein ImuA
MNERKGVMVKKTTNTPGDVDRLVERLAGRIRRLEGTEAGQMARLSSGSQALDQHLPGGGFQQGSLIEWLAGSEAGSGTAALALMAARVACKRGGALVVIDQGRWFYPPAAVAMGLDTGRLVVVRPESEEDEHWAWQQSLAAEGVAAVLGWPRKMSAAAFRRLQLAAQAGGTLGLLIRPAEVRCQPSWADVRLLVEPQPTPPNHRLTDGRTMRVTILRSRGGTGGTAVEVTTGRSTKNRMSNVEAVTNFQMRPQSLRYG